jgi:hypothetical protein
VTIQGTLYPVAHLGQSPVETLNNLDEEHRKEPALTKKLKQGDTCWGTRKLVLGWITSSPNIARTACMSFSKNYSDRGSAFWSESGSRYWENSSQRPLQFGEAEASLACCRRPCDIKVKVTFAYPAVSMTLLKANDLAIQPTRLYKIVPQPDP